MGKNKPWLYLVLIPILFLVGCANPKNQVSKLGFEESEEGISIPHPVELEKNGEQYVTIFPIILDPGLWGVEGFSHKDLDVGIFPVVTDGKLKGYAFITEANLWNDQVMHAFVVGRKNDISKIAYLSRDGHFMYDITGDEFEFDAEKFEKDSNYKSKVLLAAGMNIQEIEKFWRSYSEKRGIEIPADFQFVEEIRVGSPRWEKFKADLATRLSENYKMPDGQIRQGYMPLNDFRKEATKNYGTTGSQRFGRAAVIPATIEPISLSVGTVGSMLNGLIAASNGPMGGFYSLAECRRGDLKPRFRQMSKIAKTLLVARDQQIYQLQQQIIQLGGRP
ncbi:MAG TPA: hypothetical protein DDY52_00095 [Candidatus Moranbacteria bacterium]|nr:MAG: hypothetical protein UR51_C0011G0052 [Candidatus Moranbacteria bacterium GW2011_GWF1_34_10]HBI16548.1 hypothetical protein [Candidatus Moranbacteria bacterium]